MSRYRDRYGKRISCGDVVLVAITINHFNSLLVPWQVMICRRRGRELILDGPLASGSLREIPADQLACVHESLDLRTVWSDFRRAFPADADRVSVAAPPEPDFHWTIELRGPSGEVVTAKFDGTLKAASAQADKLSDASEFEVQSCVFVRGHSTRTQ